MTAPPIAHPKTAATTIADRARMILGLLLLSSCSGPVSQADCEYLQTTANETLNQVMAVYADSDAAYSTDNERLVAILYSEGSQALYEPEITHPKLKPIQDALVEVFQKASDIRYAASELIPAEANTLPTPEAEQQILALQVQSEAEIPSKLQALAEVCRR
ncbi:MAG: hypothetical protein AAFU71_01595 [Cyanobacteria bacterium J06632_22]